MTECLKYCRLNAKLNDTNLIIFKRLGYKENCK